MSNEVNQAPPRVYAKYEAMYRKIGLAPIPVGNEKEPLGKGWNNLSPSEAEIAKRAERFAGANIGLLAGTAVGSNTVLCHVDIDDDSVVAFVAAVLAPFITGKKGAKGLTIFVQAETGVKSCKVYGRNRNKPLVEFFVNSGMVVIPPSMHPSGKPYEWVGKPLLNVELTDLTTLTAEKITIVREVLKNEHALAIMEGGPDISGHQPMLSLTSSGIAGLTDDLPWLAGCLAALFHPSYKGNTRNEILGMLKSAKEKGLGSTSGVVRVYEPGDDGPVPLGYTKDGSFALLDRKRQIVLIASSQQLLSGQYLVGVAPSTFWKRQFPGKNGFNSLAAGEAIFEACRRKGPFTPARVRGRGIWREGARVVVNLGEPVESRDNLYLCFEPITLDPNTQFDAPRLLKLLQMFRWRDPNDAMLLFGWLALAAICGVLQRRPHCFVYGPARSGKTTIHTIASNLLNPLAIATDGQSTEAGIRQTLGPDSLAILVDEFESDQGAKGLQQIMRLARSASSAETPVLRGTPEGKAISFNIRTAFFFAAINPRGMSPADQSRIMMLELLMHDNDSDKAKIIAQEEAHFRSARGAWCSFMVGHAGLMAEAIEVFEPAIPATDRRLRQNVSTILGAAFIALHERVPTKEEALSWATEFKATINRHAEEVERDDALECLEHLFAYVVEGYPLGHWLATERQRQESRQNSTVAHSIVAMHDMRVELDGENRGFLIRNNAAAINRVFEGTVWGNGAWQRALRKLQGSFSPKNPVQFSGTGVKARCIGIPLSYLPEPLPFSEKF